MSNIVQFPKKLSIPEEQEDYYDTVHEHFGGEYPEEQEDYHAPVHEHFGGEYPEWGKPRKITIKISAPEKTTSQKAGEFALGAILASCFVMLVFVVFF